MFFLLCISTIFHFFLLLILAAGHRSLIPDLMKQLELQDAKHILVCCGGVIPQQDYDFLYDLGVTAVFGPGTRIPDCAMTCLDSIEKEAKEKDQQMNV
jgi:methylmalonyl-CoA mutase